MSLALVTKLNDIDLDQAVQTEVTVAGNLSFGDGATATGGGVSPFKEETWEAMSEGLPDDTPDGNGFYWANSAAYVRADGYSHSGTKALRVDFATGYQRNRNQNFFMGRQVSELWIEAYVRISDGAEDDIGGATEPYADYGGEEGSNNKFLRIWGADYGTNGGNKGGGSLWRDLGEMKYKGDFSSNQSNTVSPVGTSSITVTTGDRPGRYLLFQWHGRLATTVDANDGLLEWYIDGEHVHSENLDWRSADYPYWDRGYLMGYINTTYPPSGDPMRVWWDDVKFYDSDPGWDWTL